MHELNKCSIKFGRSGSFIFLLLTKTPLNHTDPTVLTLSLLSGHLINFHRVSKLNSGNIELLGSSMRFILDALIIIIYLHKIILLNL